MYILPLENDMSVRIYDDQDFCIRVKGKTKNGKVVTKMFYIKENQWDSLSTGDYVFLNEQFSKKELPNKDSTEIQNLTRYLMKKK